MCTELPLCFALWGLKRSLYESVAPPSLIYEARIFMRCYPREDLPDWVEILANGDPDNLAAVVETAKADIDAEVGRDER